MSVTCTQVPRELSTGSLAFVCLGSDNNKGGETPWGRGLRAIGVVTGKSGGPGYNDSWTLDLSVGVVLPRSLARRDFVLEVADFYRWFLDMPIIGVNAGAQQTVQLVIDGKVDALVAALASIFPTVKHDLQTVYPALAQLASFVPATPPAPTNTPSDLDTSGTRLWQLLMSRQNVVLYGPPGTGKTHLAFELSATWRAMFGPDTVLHTTFHPSYSYEMFVEGFRPVEQAQDNDGNDQQASRFALQDGLLKVACQRAVDVGPQTQVLLVIDEINRADVARVFGELITYIEPSKREEKFTLSQRPDEEYAIPKNLCFLGTMNTADKSVSLLDVALRRRFAFVEVPPDPSTFGSIPSWASEVGRLSIGDLLVALNRRLDSIGVPPDRSIGHALLHVDAGASNPARALMDRLELDIFPLIEEYCYFDRGRIREVLGSLVDGAGRWRKDVGVEEQLMLVGALLPIGLDTDSQGETVVSAETPSEDE